MRPAFTLVHGTWAPGAPWTKPTSRLSEQLRKRFGSDTPLETLNWCGWNNVRTRRRGAIRLRRHLRTVSLATDRWRATGCW